MSWCSCVLTFNVLVLCGLTFSVLVVVCVDSQYLYADVQCQYHMKFVLMFSVNIS